MRCKLIGDLDGGCGTGMADACYWFKTSAMRAITERLLNVPLVLDHQDTAALHQARVAIRRPRSALTIHKGVFADRTLPRLNAELRWLPAELGKARDIDVLLKRTGEEEVGAQLPEARATAYQGAATTLQSSDRAVS